MSILVTGGAGFIGAHTAVELLNIGESIIVVDSLINSKMSTIENIKKITKKNFQFYRQDCCNKNMLKQIFYENKIDAVIHFASLKSVEESVKNPIKYYKNNVESAITICETMQEFNCKKLVFSSSATVYGTNNKSPLKETANLNPINPYGSTKLLIEKFIEEICHSDETFSAVALRYFNPIGAHESGLIGDMPSEKAPSNLMPYILKVACKELRTLSIFGNDYNTYDGTGIRDYIHITDLAKGHLCALKYIFQNVGFEIFNIGTGKGYSVLEIVKTFEKVNKVKIPYEIKARRIGDVAISYANPEKAKKMLNFKAELNLEKMCKDSWNFSKALQANFENIQNI